MKKDNADLEALLKSIKELHAVIKEKKKLSPQEAFALGKVAGALKEKLTVEK